MNETWIGFIVNRNPTASIRALKGNIQLDITPMKIILGGL